MELMPIRFGSGSKKRKTKTFFTMRAFWLLTVFISLTASSQSRDAAITIALTNAPIEQAFKEIKKQSGYEFVYTREQLRKSVAVSLKFDSAPLGKVLEACFREQPFLYVIDGKFIALKDRIEISAPVSMKTDITGTVYGENDQPLSDASITTSTGKGTSTDNNGRFLLKDINDKEVLAVSAIGYQTRHIAVKEKSYLEIRLAVTVSEMDETLIIAYGTTTKRLSTGSVSKVTSSEIEKQPVSNVLAALEGRVPGLSITQSSGVPGANYKVQIRGQNSILQGSDPLYIIDGVPFLAGNSPINQLNTAALLSPLNILSPSDIESVEILKDAEATAIYGSRGANGVILITTKSAKNNKTSLSANVYRSWSRVTRSVPMLTTTQYVAMRREAFQNDGIIPSAQNAPDLLLWDTTRNANLQKLLTGGVAHSLNAQASFSAGTATTKFSFGTSLNKQTTVFPGDLSDTRGTVHFSLNHNPEGKKFYLHFTTDYGTDNSKLSSYDLSSFINMPPHIHLYDSTGRLNWTEGSSSFYSLGITNPLAYLNQGYLGRFDNLISNVQLGYTILKGFSFKSNLGYNLLLSDEIRTNPSTSLDPATAQLPYSTFAKRNQRNWIWEPQFEFKKRTGKLATEVLLGSTWQQNADELYFVTASNYSSDIQLKSISAAGNVATTNTFSKYRYNSAFGRFKLDLLNRYLLSLSARKDASSRFGPGRQMASFGAVGAGWIFSEEGFVKKHVKFLSFGKLRGSYGTAGNDNIGNYQFLDSWNNTATAYQGIVGLIPSRLFNPDYSWELNRKIEAAAEFGFFGDRLLFSAAYFYNRCGNQLVPYTLPIQTGFNSVIENLAALIQNKGFEFTLTGRTSLSKNIEWNGSFNLTLSRNKLLQFPGLGRSSYATQYVVGEPLSVRMLYQFLGVDSQTGIYKFDDIDKDGSFTNSDRVILKNTDPRFYGGFTNSFYWKGLSLDLVLEFRKQQGLNQYSQLSNVPGFDFRNQPIMVLGRWTEPGNPSQIQKFTQDVSSPAFENAAILLGNSDVIYSDASFIRGKTLAIAYEIPVKNIRKTSAVRVRIYMNAQNLFTITKYKGADPENQNLFALPPLRTIAGGVQINF